MQGAAGLRLVANGPRGDGRRAASGLRRRWRRKDAADIRSMRQRLENTVGAGDLSGATAALSISSFSCRCFSFNTRKNPALRVPNTLAALRALLAAGIMHEEEHHLFDSSYRFLRTIESRLQLMNSTARDQLPRDATELNKLAHLLRYSSGDVLMCDYEKTTSQIRERFDAAFDAAGK